MYLNKWILIFDLEVNGHVRLPHIPLHYWNVDSLRSMMNMVGAYINKSNKNERMFAYAQIFFELDL